MTGAEASSSSISHSMSITENRTESRVALIGVHAMRYLPNCVLTQADYDRLMRSSRALPDDVREVTDCLRLQMTTTGDVVNVVTRSFDAYEFHSLGQSTQEAPGGSGWRYPDSEAWKSFFSFLPKLAEMSELHFPVGQSVVSAGERTTILHAHFVTLWRYQFHVAGNTGLESDFQLAG